MNDLHLPPNRVGRDWATVAFIKLDYVDAEKKQNFYGERMAKINMMRKQPNHPKYQWVMDRVKETRISYIAARADRLSLGVMLRCSFSTAQEAKPQCLYCKSQSMCRPFDVDVDI